MDSNLDSLDVPVRALEAPLRIPVSNVFKGQSATASGLAVSGRIESGIVQVGEKLAALPGDETGLVRGEQFSLRFTSSKSSRSLKRFLFHRNQHSKWTASSCRTHSQARMPPSSCPASRQISLGESRKQLLRISCFWPSKETDAMLVPTVSVRCCARRRRWCRSFPRSRRK
jgi:hypothetical protein